ncbi:MAG: hypothetical protein ACOYK7_03305 [Pirellulales bacterium]|jgi:hypothetical protein
MVTAVHRQRPKSSGPLAAVVAVVALALAGAAGTPVFAQGGAALLAPPLEQAGKPVTAGNPAAMANVPGAQMAANFAAGGGAPPPAQAAAAAAGESSGPVGGQLKYMPSYAVAVLAAGLGLFMICRGSGRRRDSV